MYDMLFCIEITDKNYKKNEINSESNILQIEKVDSVVGSPGIFQIPPSSTPKERNGEINLLFPYFGNSDSFIIQILNDAGGVTENTNFVN